MKTGKITRGAPAPKARTAVTHRTIEADRRALARQARSDRKRRLAEFRAGLRARRRRAAARAGAGPLAILAEGDSWFDYPLPARGVIAHLNGMIAADLLNLAHYGDEVRDIMGVEQRRRLRDLLGDAACGFDALLFSGGGNDLVGDQFCLWLRDRAEAETPARAFDEDRLENVLRIVAAGYRDLIAMRDALAPACVIFAHGYDFPTPSGRGICGLGPWLKPSMEFRGWTDPGAQREIARILLLRFDGLLAGLEASAPAGGFVHVRTQGTLDPDTDWGNEIHPDSGGFEKIAERFRDALSARFPGRV